MTKKNNNKGFLVKLGDFITNFRYHLLILFLGLTIFCFININNVDINDSIVSYLPDNTETKKGIDIMQREFGSFDTIKLMVSNISIDDANNLSKELSKINNIDSVLFDGTQSSYKNNKALYTLQIKDLNDDEIEDIKKDIENVVSEKEYDIYSDAFEDVTDGINLALILAIVVIIVILLITSETYFEPIIAFIIFAISIILNMGSNLLLGEISYITKAIAVILQLALSIDYVIIFMNQYMKEINDTTDKVLAIKKTVSKAILEIFASSLTTISGLMALVFMQLKIGGDIGIVLSKGILCSLLTVILVMPSLLSIFTNVIIRFKKKEKIRKENKLSEFILKSRKFLLPIFIIFVFISIILIPNYIYVYDTSSASSFRLSNNTKALNNIEEEFGSNNMLVILLRNEDKDYSRELQLVNKLKENDKITSITSLGSYELNDGLYLSSEVNYLELSKIFNLDSEVTLSLYKYYANQNNELEKLVKIDDYRISIISLIYFINNNINNLPLTQEAKMMISNYYINLNESRSLLESDKYSRIILNLDAPIESKETYDLIDDIRNISKNYYDDVTLVGNTINAINLEESFTSDNIIITGITILFVAIILLFTFKSVWMSLLLILTIEGSILINFGIVSLLGKNIFFMSYIVVCAIQMGATIDYAIVIASRYEQLREKYDKKESIIKTLEDRLPAVITSGLILLIAGFLIGFISSSSIISSIGLFLGIGTLISLLATIFVLPAILYLFDKIIIKKTHK
ncbi:MAG: RND family transporter [Bacilli bacterium]